MSNPNKKFQKRSLIKYFGAAVLGTVAGGPIGFFASPIALKVTRELYQDEKTKVFGKSAPKSLIRWAQLGVVAAPVLYSIAAFTGAFNPEPSTISNGKIEKALEAPAEVATFRIGDLEITNIRLQKVESTFARSGYIFKFTGDIKNNGSDELTRAGAVGASIGACALAKVKDDKQRSFDASCNIEAALPGEEIKGGFTAQSTAMPDATKAKLCTGWFKCTDILPLS